MLQHVSGVTDEAWNENFAIRQLRVLPHLPLMLMTYVAGLDRIALRSHLEKQVDHLLQRYVALVRAMPTPPADMEADSILRDASKRVVDSLDLDRRPFRKPAMSSFIENHQS